MQRDLINLINQFEEIYDEYEFVPAPNKIVMNDNYSYKSEKYNRWLSRLMQELNLIMRNTDDEFVRGILEKCKTITEYDDERICLKNIKVDLDTMIEHIDQYYV